MSGEAKMARLFFSTRAGVVYCVGDFETEDGSARGHWRPEVRPGEEIFGVSYDALITARAGVIEIEPDGTARIA
jgi:hypothetical protein